MRAENPKVFARSFVVFFVMRGYLGIPDNYNAIQVKIGKIRRTSSAPSKRTRIETGLVDVDRGDGAVRTPAGKGKGLAPGPTSDIKDCCRHRGSEEVKHPDGAGITPGTLPVKPLKKGEEV